MVTRPQLIFCRNKKELRQTSNKFVRRVKKIFKKLPKSMEWLSFLNNDLPILMDICEEVQEAPMQFLQDCAPSSTTALSGAE